jgi:hypothetical protein
LAGGPSAVGPKNLEVGGVTDVLGEAAAEEHGGRRI